MAQRLQRPRRSAHGLRTLALPAIGLILLSGCGWHSAPAAAFFAAPRSGHAYVAQLVTEHPLYPQYQRLEQEIAALRQSCVIPAVSPVFLELGELFLPGPEPPRFPLDRFEARRRQWQLAVLPEGPPGPLELAPDLTAEMQWQEHLAHKWADQQLAEVAAREDATVAEARAQAVRDRQEAFNNAGLDLALPDREAQVAATAERQRLWQEIEIAEGEARGAAAERIAAEQRRIDAELQRRLAVAEAAAHRRMQKRTEIFLESGSETRTRMSKAMAASEPPAATAGYTWRPGVAVAPGALQPTYGPLLQRDRELRLAQAARLAAARADLAATMFQATALAIKRISGLHHWEVRLPPEEEALGQDMTEQIRPELRALFRPELR